MRSGDIYMLKRIPWYIREGKLVQVVFRKLLQFPSFSDGNCPKKGAVTLHFSKEWMLPCSVSEQNTHA
jgi:hypothetical protein